MSTRCVFGAPRRGVLAGVCTPKEDRRSRPTFAHVLREAGTFPSAKCPSTSVAPPSTCSTRSRGGERLRERALICVRGVDHFGRAQVDHFWRAPKRAGPVASLPVLVHELADPLRDIPSLSAAFRWLPSAA